MAWHNRVKQRKVFIKDIRKELIPVAWHPIRWWNWCLPEYEKKKEENQFLLIKTCIKLIDNKMLLIRTNSIQLRGTNTF